MTSKLIRSNSLEDDVREVRMLEIPQFDPSRKFEGIEKQKRARKDRHNKAIEAFSALLSHVSEELEQDVLRLSREVRENIAQVDGKLGQKYKEIESEAYLLSVTDAEIVDVMNGLNLEVAKRAELLEHFKSDLEMTEQKRANIIGSELKKLVDTLISIAHQLPNEIEHIVEGETHDLNVILTSNRKSYAQLMVMLQLSQSEAQKNSVSNWTIARQKWRELHHARSIKAFHESMTQFHDPPDRREFMEQVREQQKKRHKKRLDLLQRLSSIDAKGISSSGIETIQSEFNAMNDEELTAIQTCYNGISNLRAALGNKASNRVEELRRDLHHYAALKPEPDFNALSNKIQRIVDDQTLVEFYRFGSGLKSELQQLVYDITCDDISHNQFLVDVYDRFNLIINSFPLKDVLKTRGRSMQLDQIRNTIVKMRSVPRTDVIPVLQKLLPDLQDMVAIEQFSAIFRSTVRSCMDEITKEVARATAQKEANALAEMEPKGGANTSSGVSRTGSRGSRSTRTRRVTSTRPSSRTTRLKTADIELALIDSLALKKWSLKLCVMFYSCDLSEEYQSDIMQTLQAIEDKQACNTLIDALVTETSEEILNTIDSRYQRLIDKIANFLEVQAVSLAVCSGNICDFYLTAAKIIESHRKLQFDLDEKSMDELWDWKEDFRLEREDREQSFEDACVVLRQSVGHEELQNNFEKVIEILNEIQESYRRYHGKACFLADKHPLSLMKEFKDYMSSITLKFEASPKLPHPIITQYNNLINDMNRLNKFYVTDDPEISALLNDDSGKQAPSSSATPSLPVAAASLPPASGMKPKSRGGSPDVVGAPGSSAVNKRKVSLLLAEQPPVQTLTNEAENFVVEILSPNLAPARAPSCGSYGGKYGMKTPIETFLNKFYTDHSAEAQNAQADSEEAMKTTGAVAVEGGRPLETEPTSTNTKRKFSRPGSRETRRDKAVTAVAAVDDKQVQFEQLKKEMHPEAPWLFPVANYLSKSEMQSLTGDEKEEYEEVLCEEWFQPVDDSLLPVLTQPQKDAYQFVTNVVEEYKANKVLKSLPSYILSHPPTDVQGVAWVLHLEYTMTSLNDLLTGLRDSIIETLEKEVYDRLQDVVKINQDRKAELTDELEDRLRTHWPRRGRVETQIKQPREAELLGHEEKTWRHIESIHDRVIKLQLDFNKEVSDAKHTCDVYIHEINLLRNALGGQFKTLAALQGLDVKGRAIMLDFQSKSSSHVTKLRRMANEDCKGIQNYAKEFRKVCPRQEPGKEGGYSDSELLEIESLVQKQCDEIQKLSGVWEGIINEVIDQQEQSAKSQILFQTKYDTKVQELSLSEGLGQKYGAPRRRAQGKLRTEVTRDEQSAGKVDELIAQLEFLRAEQRRKLDDTVDDAIDQGDGNDDASVSSTNSVMRPAAGSPMGRAELDKVNEIWALMCKVRVSVRSRALYLKALLPATTAQATSQASGNSHTTSAAAAAALASASLATSAGPLPELPWMRPDRIPRAIRKDGEPAAEEISIKDTTAQRVESSFSSTGVDSTGGGTDDGGKKLCFIDVVEDADAVCRKETKELYLSEGRGDALDGQGGVPEALQHWLMESKEKLAGPGGHLEKASKRLWSQIERLEIILGRSQASKKIVVTATGLPSTMKPIEEEEEEEVDDEENRQESDGVTLVSKSSSISRTLGIPEICLHLLMVGHLEYSRQQKEIRENKFLKVLDVLEKSRVKHERSLRPRLGSPDADAVQELAELEDKENQRSKDLTDSVTRFRSVLIRFLIELCRNYVEDLLQCTKGLIQYLDSCLHRGLLVIPPGCSVPKKRLTAKRQRKAQRIKSQIELGEEDRSKERTWPSINLDRLCNVVNAVEHLVTPEDNHSVTAEKPIKKLQHRASTKKVNALIQQNELSTALLSSEWLEKLRGASAIRSGVSSAHRAIIGGRDAAIDGYVEELGDMLTDIKDKYGKILSTATGWSERWEKLVHMLRQA